MMITSQASERLVWCDFIGGESEGSLRLVRFFFLAGFSMPTTTTRILGMSTVLKTRAVGLYLVYVTVFRYISTPRRRALKGANP